MRFNSILFGLFILVLVSALQGCTFDTVGRAGGIVNTLEGQEQELAKEVLEKIENRESPCPEVIPTYKEWNTRVRNVCVQGSIALSSDPEWNCYKWLCHKVRPGQELVKKEKKKGISSILRIDKTGKADAVLPSACSAPTTCDGTNCVDGCTGATWPDPTSTGAGTTNMDSCYDQFYNPLCGTPGCENEPGCTAAATNNNNCQSDCSSPNAMSCMGNTLVQCVDFSGMGCYTNEVVMECISPETCNPAGYCEAGCPNECAAGNPTCNGNNMEECMWNPSSQCNEIMSTPCGADVCTGSQGTAACNPACPNPCTQGHTQCNGNTPQTCYNNNGCLEYFTQPSCLANEQCNPSTGACDTIPEDCSNSYDDDGDTFVDCADSDCFGDVACPESKCYDNTDDDHDGYIDCADSDCYDYPDCQQEVECDDTYDNDADSYIDCYDPDCVGTATCIENCVDTIDNDVDGLTDCDDTDCDGTATCTETDCDDTIDNDNDGYIDCFDLDCSADSYCTTEFVCDDSYDDDADGYIDCFDSDCTNDGYCQFESICIDGYDNDANGLTDCDDSYCQTMPDCMETDCSNGNDDDNDGLTDCFDNDCDQDPDCLYEAMCGDNYDNDADGLTDCDDIDDCMMTIECTEIDCADMGDSDNDGLTDCFDPDCDQDPDCQYEMICGDNYDNDADGLTDCDDIVDCMMAMECYLNHDLLQLHVERELIYPGNDDPANPTIMHDEILRISDPPEKSLMQVIVDFFKGLVGFAVAGSTSLADQRIDTPEYLQSVVNLQKIVTAGLNPSDLRLIVRVEKTDIGTGNMVIVDEVLNVPLTSLQSSAESDDLKKIDFSWDTAGGWLFDPSIHDPDGAYMIRALVTDAAYNMISAPGDTVETVSMFSIDLRGMPCGGHDECGEFLICDNGFCADPPDDSLGYFYFAGCVDGPDNIMVSDTKRFWEDDVYTIVGSSLTPTSQHADCDLITHNGSSSWLNVIDTEGELFGCGSIGLVDTNSYVDGAYGYKVNRGTITLESDVPPFEFRVDDDSLTGVGIYRVRAECLDCSVDGDCPGNDKCDPVTSTCLDVECLEDSHCTTPPKCETTSHMCVECVDDTDCSGEEICNADFECAFQEDVECIPEQIVTGFEDDVVGDCPEGWTCQGDGMVLEEGHMICNPGDGSQTGHGMGGSNYLKAGCDVSIGRVESQSFVLPDDIDSVEFLRAGGADVGGLYVERVNGVRLCAAEASANTDSFIVDTCPGLGPYAGREVKIVVTDEVSEGWGKTYVDDIKLVAVGGGYTSPVCIPPSCADDSECSGDEKCDTTTGICEDVECLTDTHCTAPQKCELISKGCVDCLDDNDCGDGGGGVCPSADYCSHCCVITNPFVMIGFVNQYLTASLACPITNPFEMIGKVNKYLIQEPLC